MEIELKFDIKEIPKDFEIKKVKHIKQSYIYFDKYTVIRKREVEVNDETKYYYTVKCDVDQIDKLGCHEIEDTIEKEDYYNLPVLKHTREIIKERLIVELDNNLIAEIDLYKGELEGFITIEVEFESVEDANNFIKPDWFGDNINITNKELSLMSNVDIEKLNKHPEITKKINNLEKNVL